jgi:hypothetical protein
MLCFTKEEWKGAEAKTFTLISCSTKNLFKKLENYMGELAAFEGQYFTVFTRT